MRGLMALSKSVRTRRIKAPNKPATQRQVEALAGMRRDRVGGTRTGDLSGVSKRAASREIGRLLDQPTVKQVEAIQRMRSQRATLGGRDPQSMTKSQASAEIDRLKRLPRIQTGIQGRLVVLTPNSKGCNVSAKLNEGERQRLRAIATGLVPTGYSLIVRTAAQGATRQQLEAEVRQLLGRASRELFVEVAAPRQLRRIES